MLRGTRVGQAYVAVTADGSGINEEIVDAVDEAGKDIDDKGREHGDDYGEGFSEGFLSRMRGKIGARLSDALGSERIGGEAGDDAGTSFVERMSEKVEGLGERLRDELSDRLASNPEQVRRGIDRAFDDDFADRLGDRLGSRMVDGIVGAIDRQSGVLSAALSEALEEAVSGNGSGGGRGGRGGIAGVVGRMLGEGSRNNFLNLLGKTMGNVVGLVEKGATFASTFATNMNKAGEGAGLIARLMAGFGSGGGFLKFGASLPVLVVGLGAATLALSLMVSVASTLLGILVAMASTIASALVGALAVGAGALGALAAAAGLVTIAFTSMTNAQSRALSEAFQPLKAAATGLGQIMLREMVPAFESWSRNLQVALSLAAPLAQVMGGAFARAGNILTESFSGPGVQRLLDVLGVTLPGIVTNLSRAFGGFLNGVSGVFAALLPSVLRFTEYLARVAARFAEWAASARGQNAIKDFVDRALDSLKSFWNFLKAVGGLLNAVLFNPEGQKAGNGIFDGMARSVRKFTDYISKEDRLENWFKRARRFATTLGSAIEGIGKILDKLDSSSAIDVIISLAKFIEKAAKWAKFASDYFNDIPQPIQDLLSPLTTLADLIDRIAGNSERAASAMSQWAVPPGMLSGAEALNQLLVGPLTATSQGFIGPIGPDTPPMPNQNDTGLQDLINAGNEALNNTYESNGGYMPDPTDPPKKGPKYTQFEGGPVEPPAWVNPMIAYANSIIQQLPGLQAEIREMFRTARDEMFKTISESAKLITDLTPQIGNLFSQGIIDALAATDVQGVVDSFSSVIDQATANYGSVFDQTVASAQGVIDNATAARDQMVSSAQSAVQAAAERLKSATNKKDLLAASQELDAAKQALAVAYKKGNDLVQEAQDQAAKMIADVQAVGDGVARANAIVAGQSVYNYDNALNLARGLRVESATLADYAEARRWAAERLGEASTKLAEAINIRDSYSKQVADSIRTFGTLLSAQAQTVNGVLQALNSDDIIDSMRERVEKVRAFQSNLRLLLAQGLSDAAYKQLVDAGVEQGGAYADALVNGGQGAISEVNNLTAQFNQLGEELGLAASSQMYQAGVDAAQGLVDGLLSLSAQLDSAAASLGAAIAAAVKRELGIASPSRVLAAMMDDVGDGAVLGLDNQHDKVDAASARLSERITVSPEVAAYAASQGASPTTDGGVSGNAEETLFAGRIRDLHVHTPTEDPYAVATEVLDELTGQL